MNWWRQKWHIVLLVALLLGSAALHLCRISIPTRPVFDEAHFATYALDYYTGTTFFDIHPPLGKLMYAEVLRLTSYRSPTPPPQFVQWTIDADTGLYHIIKSEEEYGNFPYVALRLFGSLFGVLLPLALYAFLRNSGVGKPGALIAAFCVVFESAILLQTRLILMDGMYLVFGFTALALYFATFSSRRAEKWRPFSAGIFFGLSLGVKLIGVVFLVPVLVSFYLQKKSEREKNRPKLRSFFFAGCVLFFFLALADNLFFSVQSRIALWQTLGFAKPNPASLTVQVPDSIPRYLLAAFTENFFEVSKNIDGVTDTRHGPWYLWPFMQKPILYLKESATSIFILQGNPIVWFGSTFAVLAVLAVGIGRFKKYWRERSDVKIKTPLLLSIGYIGALLPFFTIIRRTTFLYHYFPALLFAFGILGWGIEKVLKLNEPGRVSRRSIFGVGLLLCLIIAGFIWSAPRVFGY